MNVKQAELMNLAMRLIPKYPDGLKHVEGVKVKASPRRALKNAQALKRMDWNAIFKSTNYEYAVREGMGYKVQ